MVLESHLYAMLQKVERQPLTLEDKPENEVRIQLYRQLAKRKLVTEQTSPHDRYASTFTITPAGRKELKKAPKRPPQATKAKTPATPINVTDSEKQLLEGLTAGVKQIEQTNANKPQMDVYKPLVQKKLVAADEWGPGGGYMNYTLTDAGWATLGKKKPGKKKYPMGKRTLSYLALLEKDEYTVNINDIPHEHRFAIDNLEGLCRMGYATESTNPRMTMRRFTITEKGLAKLEEDRPYYDQLMFEN